MPVAAIASIAIILLLSPLSAQSAQPEQEDLPQWRVLLHSHAALEAGWDKLVELEYEAQRRGLHAIITTDQLVMEWDWGLSIIRSVCTYTHKEFADQSIMHFGVEDYFDQIEEADRAVPGITLIAGAEVAPYYYWTGFPWNRNDKLTMWNWQRNILVLDLPDASSYERLPVLGLRRSIVQSLKDLPWLLVLLGMSLLFLWTLNRLYFIRASLALIPVVLLIWSGPPATGPFSPYRTDAGIAPYQALIDSVNQMGGISIWTQVEARDDRNYSWGEIHTAPHPQVLLESVDYHGFGSLYPDNTHAQEPGREWDRALTAYLEGKRRIPPYGWGEMALHYPKQVVESGKEITDIVTVLLAPDASRESLMDALRHGRGYSVRSGRSENFLRLTLFEAADKNSRAGMGQFLNAAGPVTVRAVCEFTGTEPPEVTATLIRSGEVVATRRGAPPMELFFTEPDVPPGNTGAFYRLQIEGRVHRLLSNPIFIEYTDAADTEGGGV